MKRILAAILAAALAAGALALCWAWIVPGYSMGIDGEPLRMCCPQVMARLLRGAPESAKTDPVTGRTTLVYPSVRAFGLGARAEYEFLEGGLTAARYQIPAGDAGENRYRAVCEALIRSGCYAEWAVGSGEHPLVQRGTFETARNSAGTGMTATVEQTARGVEICVEGFY